MERLAAGRPLLRIVLTAAATWTVLGGRSLGREADGRRRRGWPGMILPAARVQVRNLVGRDTADLGADEIARACVESVAENTSDAVVAPLLWGAVAGMPGLLGYRAANTLDAMIGHRSTRYRRFGWAAARLDDLVNWVPARVSGTGRRGDWPAGRRHVRGRRCGPSCGTRADIRAPTPGWWRRRSPGRSAYGSAGATSTRARRRTAGCWANGRAGADRGRGPSGPARRRRRARRRLIIAVLLRAAPPMTILIIGGTAEARALAAELVGAGVEVITSLAGRVRDPALPAGQVRIGGFGGVAGLVAFLIEQRITAVVDASHPFAAQISTNVERASVEVGVPLLRLERPGWAGHPHAAFVDLGARCRGGPGGRRGVPASVPDHRPAVAAGLPAWADRVVLVRVVDPPEFALPERWTMITSRGPYALRRRTRRC